MLTVIVSLIILKKSYNERISPVKNENITNNLVIAISREYGTNGKEIAKKGNCVIVGRAADYILREDEQLVRIFLYAPLEYRLNKVMEIYHDSHEDALQYIHKSDHSRKSYYEVISNKTWGDKSNYDLCLDCKLGNETIKDIIYNYVKSLDK